MIKNTSVWFWTTVLLAAVILAVSFFAYLQPGLLLNFMNLRYCG